MKKLIIVILVILGITGLGYSVGEINGSSRTDMKEQEDYVASYFIDLPDGLDTIDFNASITLDQTKKIHRLKFPNGGTGTTVFIYDGSYLNHPDSKSLINGSFQRGNEVVLDITLLKQGQYYVHYLSCNLGGIFPLTIN